MAEFAHYTHTTIERELESLSKTGLGERTAPHITRWITRTIFFGSTRRLAQPELRLLFTAAEKPLNELRTIQYEEMPDLRSDMPQVVLVDSGADWRSERVHHINDWRALELAAGYFRSAWELRRVMREWASERKVAWQWFYDAALVNLACGRGAENWEYPGSMCIGKGKRYGAAAGEPWAVLPIPPVEFEGYNPLAEDRSEWLKRLTARANEYCDAQERLLKQAGLLESTGRRRRSGPAWFAADWFVRNRIQGEKQADIAEEYSITSERVSKGITEIQNLLT